MRVKQTYKSAMRISALFLLIYGVHLFTFHTLLSNPCDNLTSSSFGEYLDNPGKASDCLLLLAKQQVCKSHVNPAKAQFCTPVLFGNLAAVTTNAAVATAQSDNRQQNKQKLYRTLRVFRI